MAVMASVRRTQEPTAGVAGVGLNVVAVAIVLSAAIVGGIVSAILGNPIPLVVSLVIGLLIAPAPQIAQQWERAVVLRFGRYVGLRGPGLF
jgi:regulator of protease activity HflC (stomatin/prohibitin superfamily)